MKLANKKQIIPITPAQARGNLYKKIPPEVIRVFNDMLTEHAGSSTITLNQKDVVGRIINSMGVSLDEVFASGWLNIEPIYKNAGWIVFYNKLCYNETNSQADSTFTFTENREYTFK